MYRNYACTVILSWKLCILGFRWISLYVASVFSAIVFFIKFCG